MFQKRIPKVTLCCLLIIHIPVSGYTGLQSQDQTSSRTNTLFDDADDIQRQLDNEARDRIKFGRPKTIWVFHFPTHFPDHNSIVETTEKQIRIRRHLRHSIKRKEEECEDEDSSCCQPPWEYGTQAEWLKKFPDCGGKSQSPVNLPVDGLIKPRGARPLLFQNHDVPAKSMTLMIDGIQMVLSGEWKNENRPLIYGGAAHSRRYLFHSMVIHLPAEHTVGSLYFPLETQVYYISAEYKDMQEALQASSDQQAILAISNMFSYGNHTHQGLADILVAAKKQGCRNGTLKGSPLSYFNPPFKEYACYQGSLSTPPCTESVLWLIRGRTMHIKREAWESAQKFVNENFESRPTFRLAQPLNDRRIYFFK
ncbi:hypothetical protein PYW08_001458 [Mythimna loreyi]|uniref:Uncharacterized protein n=1 Tax=Mythimna loreyi TaxID=667449 RepID=A0ACC2R419_9NEOP|nr:hypothetical protein PYW08_001458 [Mythimna loreyi]